MVTSSGLLVPPQPRAHAAAALRAAFEVRCVAFADERHPSRAQRLSRLARLRRSLPYGRVFDALLGLLRRIA